MERRLLESDLTSHEVWRGRYCCPASHFPNHPQRCKLLQSANLSYNLTSPAAQPWLFLPFLIPSGTLFWALNNPSLLPKHNTTHSLPSPLMEHADPPDHPGGQTSAILTPPPPTPLSLPPTSSFPPSDAPFKTSLNPVDFITPLLPYLHCHCLSYAFVVPLQSQRATF